MSTKTVAFYPFQVIRSDAKLFTYTKDGVKEANEPDAKKRSDTPNDKGMVDCYRKLGNNDPKAVDWRRKLGGMCARDIGGDEQAGKSWILKEFPQDFVLWEHVKYNTNKDATNKGKHAGGSYDRQDAYLYGHPQGTSKRFRSPADFYPHMLWLASSHQDNLHCSCKLCSPADREDPMAESSKGKTAIKKETRTPIPVPMPVSVPLSVPVPASTPLAESKPTPPILPPVVSSPVRSAEQKADSEPDAKFIFRPGELVWFDNGLNWRLGVISKRQVFNGHPRYLINPLSNPLQPQPQQIKDQESSLRPWLAWSVPNTTIPHIQNMTFEQAPWDQIVSGEFKNGDAVVDGSILAARAIDSSYSLFDRNENALAGPGEVHYRGMFLGAEKIWVGEPVRLRVIGNDIVVMILHKLIEKTTAPTSVIFVGDIYKFVSMPMPYKHQSEWPTPDLPPRMLFDLRFRNEVADMAKKGVWYEWRLLEPAAKRGLADIKGRWYETRTLLPILRGAQKYQEDMSNGITSDAGEWMNGRRDKNNNPEQRRKNRKDTLGASVPADFKASRGLDGPPADDVFPDTHGSHPTFVESDIDQFMDLDGGVPNYYGLGH